MRTTNPKVIEKAFNDKFKAVSNNIDEAFIEIGERGVNYLKLETPVDTGRLRQSMSYTTDGKVYRPLGHSTEDTLRPTSKKESVYIGTNVIYAPSVEYRAKNGSAGFMYRAYKQLRKRAPEIIKQAMQKGMKK